MKMKKVMKYWLLIFCIGFFIFSTDHVLSAKQGPPKIPPGQAKKGELPPGQAKKQGDSQSLPPGITKQQGLLPMDFEQELRQAWCLEHEGTVNLVLPDETICECLTKTHAIAFASEDSWLDALGKSLHFALTTGKDPAIVILTKDEETPQYVLQLNAIIKHFELPIFLWEEVIEIEEGNP